MAATADFVAGAVGGCAGILVGHPLDTIKVQIQTQGSGNRYNSMLDCFKTISSQKLSKGFYCGMSGPLLSYGYLSAIFFGCYGWTLKKLNYEDNPEEKRPIYSTVAIASVVATVPQVMCSCPIEVIKVVLQSQIPHRKDKFASGKIYKGPIETAVTIFRTNGLQGLYRGFLTHLSRDLPSAAMYMTLYKGAQYEGHKHFPSVPTQIINFLGGGFAGVLCWAAILPLDVIKSKLQADPQKIMYRGFWDCAKQLFMTEGASVFFSGFIPLSIRAFLVNSVMLMVYSESLHIFERLEKDYV